MNNKYRIFIWPTSYQDLVYTAERKGWFFWHYISHNRTEAEARASIEKYIRNKKATRVLPYE